MYVLKHPSVRLFASKCFFVVYSMDEWMYVYNYCRCLYAMLVYFCAFSLLIVSGTNCATLHYGHAGAPNDRTMNDGDLWLEIFVLSSVFLSRYRDIEIYRHIYVYIVFVQIEAQPYIYFHSFLTQSHFEPTSIKYSLGGWPSS